jgi:thiaminase/transcriptional activator TenA
VRGIGAGTLDVEKFKLWLRQDYLFLKDYCRLSALAAARAPDLESMTRFAELLYSTLTQEMELHRSYAREFGITREELEREQRTQTTQAYTDFLLCTGTLASYPELLAALLPCMWGFCEVGQRLKRKGLPKEPRYAKWIEMYSSEEFSALAAWCRRLVDLAAKDLSPEELRRLEKAFLTSSRYELLFWEMAWKLERWPA